MPLVVLNELVNSLHEMVIDAKPALMAPDKCAIRKKDLIYLIEEIMRCMPADVEKAHGIVNARKELIEQSQEEYRKIISDAHEEAEKIIAKERVVIEAQKRAEEIENSAKTKSRQIYGDVTDFCHKKIFEAEKDLAHVLEELKNTRTKLNKDRK